MTDILWSQTYSDYYLCQVAINPGETHGVLTISVDNELLHEEVIPVAGLNADDEAGWQAQCEYIIHGWDDIANDPRY